MLWLLLITAGCGETPGRTPAVKDGGGIVFAIGSDPRILNPLYASDRVTMTVNNALYSPLFVLEGGQPEYCLAESLTASGDYKTYTLKLKKGLKWHDGRPLTAADVVFTIEKVLDPKQNCFLRELFLFDDTPVAVKQVDDSTVEFVLPEVSMAFTDSLAQIVPIPRHRYENEADLAKSAQNEQPVGSGPFKFKEFKPGESVTLVRFDDYFGGRPHLDTVVYRVIADENAAGIALQNGEIAAQYIQPKDAEKYHRDGRFNVVLYSEDMLHNMIISLANPALRSKEVRQAIAYAVNKDELVAGAYQSAEYAEKAFSVFTPNTLYYTTDLPRYDHSEAKARELLAKAGVSSLKLRLYYLSSRKEHECQALIVQQNLKKVGIDVELLPTERGAFLKKLLDQQTTDMDLVFNAYVLGSEPDSYKSAFMTGKIYNFSHYSNPALDELWRKGAVEPDKAAREAIYKEIQQILAEDMVLYPIVYPKSIVAISKKYGGIQQAKPVPIFMFRDLGKLYLAQ